ncbi:hypothetical protein PspLS_00776 [Pyricularia sp. CBS 133598]|nr:hypothetical protein PspLS_00776 [Pyricularia sp. CBS 133598]
MDRQRHRTSDFAYHPDRDLVTVSSQSSRGRPEHAYATKHPNFHDRKRFPELNDITLHPD